MLNKNNKLLKIIVAIMFIVFFTSIVALNIITPNKDFSELENRVLQKKPKFSIESLLEGKFTKKYEEYISDQFAFRDFWVELKSKCDKFIGKKESNDVYLGKDDYLLEKFKAPSQEEVDNRVNAINNFDNQSKELKKYIVLAPTAVDILKDKLPHYVVEPSEKTYLDKFKDGLNEDINFVDVYEKLNSKKDEYIYYKTDHHWTTDGAFYAYEELAKSMNLSLADKDNFDKVEVNNEFLGSLYSKGNFRDVSSDSINLYKYKNNIEEDIKIEYPLEEKESNSMYAMDNLKKKDKYTVFLDGNHPLVKISTKANSDRKLLIVKDSYANSFVPFLINDFSEIYMVDLRYYTEDLSKLIEKNEIDEMLMLYNANTFFQDTSIKTIKY
ncbi:DHHW family protein [Clostridium senegalense]|uniref:DHHW family protein n=1 Tax=Clostridium senegalense TaxID=1465809 RepID=UPI00325B2BCF